MKPSSWVGFIEMVHEMSGENESYILSRMPYARGLQYQIRWLRRHGQFIVRPGIDKGLKTVL